MRLVHFIVVTATTFLIAGTTLANDQDRDLPTKNEGMVETICGGSDDRVISNKPFIGRMLKHPEGSAPCSATLVGNSCMVSAGHCVDYLKLAEFNTPESEDRRIVHAQPEDQYEVDQEQFTISSPTRMGNDWAVFKVKANPITGLLPGEAQNGYMEVSFDVPLEGIGIEITGYGTDTENNTNFAQQESFGDLRSAGSDSNSTLKYHTDTTGGNSGSGVIDEANQAFIGVHTHGGCNQSRDSANSGTSLHFNAEFLQALKDCLENDRPDSSNP